MLIKNTNMLSKDGTILKNVDINIKNEKIDFIGSNFLGEYTESFDGVDMLVLPGLCNTHCHVPMTLLRGLGGSLPLERWLNEAIFPTEAKLTEEMVYYGALLGISEMLKGGITSFNDMYYYSHKICDAVIESGIKANIAMDGFAFSDSLKSKFSITDFQLYDFHKEYNGRNNDSLKIDMCIHAEYTSDPIKIEKLVKIASDTNSRMQLHLSETEKENLGCFKRHKKTPSGFFNDLGVFDLPSTAAHCVYLTQEDLNILKEKHVSVAHCPISNLKLGSGIADIVKIKNHGINITLGTDGAASNDNLDMLSDMKTAILLQKGIHKDASLLNSFDIFQISSKNGFISQGRNDCGELSVGSSADLFIVDFKKPNLQPVTDMLNSVIYSSLSDNVVLTMIKGKVVYKNNEFLTIDMEKVLYKIKELGNILY